MEKEPKKEKVAPKVESDKEEVVDNEKSLIKGTVLWRYVRAKDTCVSKDIYEKIDVKTKQLIDEAIERAKTNGRKTVRAGDF